MSYDCLKLENQLCFPLYASSHYITKKYKPYLDELDLTYTQYITMMVLWERNTVNVKELGHCLFLDSGTLTPLLKRLESKGLVLRERSADDERIVNVSITQKGRDLELKAKDIPNKIGVCVKLNDQEAHQLYTLLYKIINGGE
ncbi:MarR family transcriptional regulator [Eggerthia catenaformis]|uniref:MarR family winged helix-turn-helix transcriptional regulator n=1 Tax=Eggerthia catenaformis TaxID=31973 RepID=UPI0028E406E6|nr:MarR family transcriptional regulator [Eggerthia catenaformis]